MQLIPWCFVEIGENFGGANEIRTRVLPGFLCTSTIIVYFDTIVNRK